MSLKKGIYFLAAAAAVFFTPVQAKGEALTLTLQDAVRIAVSKDIDVLKSLQDMEKSHAAETVARSALFPSLSIGGNYTRKNGKYALAGKESSYGVSITANQPIWTGGRAKALLRQSKAFEESTLARAENTRENAVYAVISRFSTILYLRETVAAARDSVAFAENHLREVVKKEALGVANRFEVTRAEQQLSSYKTQLIAAANSLSSAEMALLTALRMDPNSPVDIQGELKYVLYQGEREKSLEKAMANRPDLKAARSALAMQKEEIQIAASGLRPKINMRATYTWDDPKRADGEDDDDWRVALDAEIPILDRNLTKAQIMTQKAQYEQMALELERLKEAIRSDVAQVWLDLETAGETVNSTTKDLELASESLRLAQVGYKEGVSSQIDVLDAQASYTRARKEHAAAVSDYTVMVSRLKRTEGELIEFVTASGGDLS